MPHSVSSKDEIVQNMNDITSDFACLKVSALEKASRISGEIDRITIGPDSAVNEDEHEKSENIENEQNSCNIKAPQRSIHSKNNKTSTQNGITFSVKKILLESELQRKEEVQKEIERHWQRMKENGKAIQEHMAASRSHMAKERERKSAENFAHITAKERIAEQEEIRRRQEQEKEVEEYRKKMKEKEELNNRITNLRDEFEKKYRNIILLTEDCKDKNSVAILLSSYAMKLKEFFHQIERIDEKIRTGDLVPTDLNLTEMMVCQINEILCSFKSEIERINAQYEANLISAMQSARELQQQAQAQAQAHILNQPSPESIQKVLEVATPEQVTTNNIRNEEAARYTGEVQEKEQAIEIIKPSDSAQTPQTPVTNSVESSLSEQNAQEYHVLAYVDKDSLQMYINSQQFLENYVNSYDEFLQSPSTKKFRFECQKAINIPVNAISGISEQHLRDKYERLHSLLIGKSSPNVAEYPQGAAFCKNILAKKIVSQGETLVSSKPKMAFPIAAIVVALWNDHSDIGDLLLAHFHNVCPFTVPLFMPRTEGQTNEDYYKSMGYKYSEDGVVEKHDKYLKRMSGLMRLYASITITMQRKGITKNHPYGLQNAWRWLAAVLNIEPRADVTDLCATLILDMLEVAGNALWNAYPKQFHKLVMLLSQEYYPRMQSVGCVGGGPLVRLEEFLRNSLTRGSIPPPEGHLPPYFW